MQVRYPYSKEFRGVDTWFGPEMGAFGTVTTTGVGRAMEGQRGLWEGGGREQVRGRCQQNTTTMGTLHGSGVPTGSAY